MADEQEKQVETTSGKKSGFNIKVLIIGIPLFIIQLVAVYFITANFLLSKMQSSSNQEKAKSEEVKSENSEGENKKVEFGKFIYVVDDLIINPANTDGKRLLLSSLGFDVASKENEEELKAKDVLLKDAIISVMSSKSLPQLANMAYRDTLRMEITGKIQQLMPKVKINTIYFSKYILQ
ncbi:MAG: flagellar basal body-associated FliL family protein [Stygiobacter sp.]|jgi:flagellar FliL protein|uniref:Flagellar protein FliL n=1 Tax=Stygiobacter electus TaxID=3032292 RepID=A0AAE3TDI2_9BACT|nr:flagellar basal body-associated FliL family protein [Stygiobacter electus]MDF1611253.1 flagellar basal body-associated FliL family protein [Stygiobacter electus]